MPSWETYAPFVAGILRCEVCEHETRIVAAKRGPMWISKGMVCTNCTYPECVWDDVQHFADEEGAMAYASSLDINEPTPTGAG